jgi:hypothetical protein
MVMGKGNLVKVVGRMRTYIVAFGEEKHSCVRSTGNRDWTKIPRWVALDLVSEWAGLARVPP